MHIFFLTDLQLFTCLISTLISCCVFPYLSPGVRPHPPPPPPGRNGIKDVMATECEGKVNRLEICHVS
jgi:hypothetical protein